MKHDDAKDQAIETAAWLHFEGTPAVQVVDSAIEKYATLMGIDKEVEQPPTVPPEPKTTPDPTPGHDKKFFEIIDHRGKPDLRPMGLEPLQIWYEGAFFDDKNSESDVNANKVKAVARAQTPPISCPDIERWADKNTWRVSPSNIKRYIEFCRLYRANLPPGHQFGLYSILPVRNYFDAVGDKGPAGFAKWQSWNDEVAPIAEHVDMLFPSLYTFSSVFQDASDRLQEWEIYAVADIQEARRIAPGKPIYPFIWPWYHPSAVKAIDPTFWRVQMEVCTEHADGFVIWDDLTKTKTDWGKLPGWWDETVDFLKEVR